MISTLWQDVRYGVRMLLKNPGFALIAIGSIGIGVGANTAIFSFADGLLLRPLGVPRAGEVLSIVGTTRETGFQPPGVSYPDFVDLRNRTQSFERLVAYRDVLTAFDARADQPALRTIGAAVSGEIFDAMNIQPSLGRFFRSDEDRAPGRDAVVVLDHRAWTDRFGADPQILGRRVRISNVDFTVVGVAPASFRGLASDVWPTFYIPLAMIDAIQPPPSAELTRRDLRAMDVKGRLRDGVTIEQARADITRIGAALATEHPDTNRAMGLAVRTEFELRAGGPDAALLMMLSALAVVVLLVACANVAGLLTSRAPVRAREMALRLAIGAGRLRLVRQLIIESLLMAVGGAAAGLAIAYGGILLFRRIELPTEVPLKLYFELDQRVLVVGLVVAVATAVLSSLIPAWQTTRADLVSPIKSAIPAGRSRQFGRHSLVCLQVALSLVLVTVATALYGGFNARVLRGPGFRTDRLLLMRFDERLVQYDATQARQFYRQLKERVAAIPGVRSVAFTSSVPLKTDTSEAMRVAPEGVRLPDDAPTVRVRSSRVDENFFETLGIRIIEGRGVAATDTSDAPAVAVVNQAFAARYWPGRSAIGRRVQVQRFNDTGTGSWHQIVGVAATATYDWMGETPQDFIYVPREQSAATQHTMLVEADRPEAVAGPVRDAVRAIDGNMPMFSVRTMADLYQRRGVEVINIIISTVGAMGTMGLMLALVGLYGLVSYAVARRTREIGIRMAVGARPRAVLGMVLRRGFVLTVVGLALGTVGSAAAGRALQAAIPGIGDFGLSTYAVVIPVLFVITLGAALVPARRASLIDPLRALRAE